MTRSTQLDVGSSLEKCLEQVKSFLQWLFIELCYFYTLCSSVRRRLELWFALTVIDVWHGTSCETSVCKHTVPSVHGSRTLLLVSVPSEPKSCPTRNDQLHYVARRRFTIPCPAGDSGRRSEHWLQITYLTLRWRAELPRVTAALISRLSSKAWSSTLESCRRWTVWNYIESWWRGTHRNAS